MFNWIGKALSGGLLSEVVGYFKDKAEGKRKIQQARVEAEATTMVERVKGEIEWENRAVSDMSKSWKDEYLVVVFTIPIIFFFLPIPGITEYLATRFVSLEMAIPSWYIDLLIVMVLVSFGLKPAINGVGTFFQRRKNRED